MSQERKKEVKDAEKKRKQAIRDAGGKKAYKAQIAKNAAEKDDIFANNKTFIKDSKSNKYVTGDDNNNIQNSSMYEDVEQQTQPNYSIEVTRDEIAMKILTGYVEAIEKGNNDAEAKNEFIQSLQENGELKDVVKRIPESDLNTAFDGIEQCAKKVGKDTTPDNLLNELKKEENFFMKLISAIVKAVNKLREHSIVDTKHTFKTRISSFIESLNKSRQNANIDVRQP